MQCKPDNLHPKLHYWLEWVCVESHNTAHLDGTKAIFAYFEGDRQICAPLHLSPTPHQNLFLVMSIQPIIPPSTKTVSLYLMLIIKTHTGGCGWSLVSTPLHWDCGSRVLLPRLFESGWRRVLLPLLLGCRYRLIIDHWPRTPKCTHHKESPIISLSNPDEPTSSIYSLAYPYTFAPIVWHLHCV